MSVELKPCPFCGSTNLKVWDNSVACHACDGTGPDLGHCVGEVCRQQSIEAWNTRAPEPNQARIEALSAALRDIDAVACDFGHYEAAARAMKEIATKALEKLWSEQ